MAFIFFFTYSINYHDALLPGRQLEHDLCLLCSPAYIPGTDVRGSEVQHRQTVVVCECLTQVGLATPY